jgi:hypothetical protein
MLLLSATTSSQVLGVQVSGAIELSADELASDYADEGEIPATAAPAYRNEFHQAVVEDQKAKSPPRSRVQEWLRNPDGVESSRTDHIGTWLSYAALLGLAAIVIVGIWQIRRILVSLENGVVAIAASLIRSGRGFRRTRQRIAQRIAERTGGD